MTGYVDLPFHGDIDKARLDTAAVGVYRIIGSEEPMSRYYDAVNNWYVVADTVRLGRDDDG